MLSLATLLVLASSALPSVLAHGGVLSYAIEGNWYWGWKPYNSASGQTTIQRPWYSYNPITNVSDPTLACNDNGTSGDLQLTASVTAGSSITAYWNQVWPHAIGPMLTYLAQCPGSTCTGVDATTIKWFKIDEVGLISGTVADGYWGDGEMIDQNSSWTTTIPTTVPSGNYLIRFETIALHSLPAQMYPECAQIEITGGGSLEPTEVELVTFPGGYGADDPGLTVDVYGNAALTQTTYIIPGPPLYGTSGSGSSSSSSSGSGTSASVPSTTKAPSSTSASSSAASTSTAVAGTVAQYGQCGGINYTGATSCISPYTCTVLNDYYSQCL
ncbi:hypothetical protein EW146_g7807 [Bondarzewia mesenterica]|uniref:AA9 family lytic polysaccharide monooxygenase n=1 Tax=Bondarzewia mesenterica TaxID=1095465 RepID=A0A4S4LJ85_9AGAM|nr:hypothetical protein EW146_g7807 [Bondarzewia mesenterica]